MNIALTKKYHRRAGPLSALLARNPVLVLGLDLPFFIVCATTLRTAVALSIEMFCIHMVTMAVALVTVRRMHLWSRMLINVGAAFVVMIFARSFVTGLFPNLSNYVGMYIYLMAVNGITIYQSSHLTRKHRVGPVLASAFMNALAFGLTMVLVSLVREFFGNGTIWGFAVSTFRLTGISMPFAGFVIMGFFLAFTKLLNKKLLAFSIVEAARRDARYTHIQARPLPLQDARGEQDADTPEETDVPPEE